MVEKTKNFIGARCLFLALLEEPGTRSGMEAVVVLYFPLTEDSRRAETDKNWYKFSGTNVKSTQVNSVHTFRSEKRSEYGSLYTVLS
jgi:hypothetical protein